VSVELLSSLLGHRVDCRVGRLISDVDQMISVRLLVFSMMSAVMVVLSEQADAGQRVSSKSSFHRALVERWAHG
jgi:hypothetical protein